MVRILFKTADGIEHPTEIEIDYSVMDAGYNNNVPGIEAECGGAAACATCHVYVAAEWLSRTGTMQDTEDAMLFMTNDRRPNSRLACQIRVSEELDGLEVEVADNTI